MLYEMTFDVFQEGFLYTIARTLCNKMDKCLYNSDPCKISYANKVEHLVLDFCEVHFAGRQPQNLGASIHRPAETKVPTRRPLAKMPEHGLDSRFLSAFRGSKDLSER